jgi:hypothetical protein
MPFCVYFDEIQKGLYTCSTAGSTFISAWLLSYCVTVELGAFIRPQVFMAAASIAQRIQRSIGLASAAHSYSSIDDILLSIIENDSSASECELPLPTHFIMGWYMPATGRPCRSSPFPCHSLQIHHPSLSMSQMIQECKLTCEIRIAYFSMYVKMNVLYGPWIP